MILFFWFLFYRIGQVSDTDDADKKKIKIEEALDDIATQPNHTTAHGHESPQNGNQPQELVTAENATTVSNESDAVTSASLPTAVITTQKHRMITTAGQIQYDFPWIFQ